MGKLLIRDPREPSTSSVLERRAPEARKGKRSRFLTAREHLQQLGEGFCLSVTKSKRPAGRQGGKHLRVSKADLASDQFNHEDVAAAARGRPAALAYGFSCLGTSGQLWSPSAMLPALSSDHSVCAMKPLFRYSLPPTIAHSSGSMSAIRFSEIA